jgi:hypothetical protein
MVVIPPSFDVQRRGLHVISMSRYPYPRGRRRKIHANKSTFGSHKLAHWVRPEEAEEASSFCETTVFATISIATGCCPVHKEEGGRRE